MTELRRKSFLDPDDAVRLPLIEEDIVELGGYTVARVVQAPGWAWSRDMAPLVLRDVRVERGAVVRRPPRAVPRPGARQPAVHRSGRLDRHRKGMGDAAWREALAVLHATRAQLEVFHGREVAVTGDGMLALFDGPALAVRCGRRSARRRRRRAWDYAYAG